MPYQSVYAFLDSLGIGYTCVEHSAAMTMEACEDIAQQLDAPFCKNLFLQNRQGTHFYLLLISPDKPFVTREVSKTLGVARLSFGSGEKLKKLLDCTAGSISPMGLIFDEEQTVELVIDRDMIKHKYFCVHPCDNTKSLKISTDDFLNVFLHATHHTPNIIDIDAV